MKAGTGSVDPSLMRRLEVGPVDGFVEGAVDVVIDQRDAAQVVGQRVGHLVFDPGEAPPDRQRAAHQPAYRATSSAFDSSRGGVGDGRAEDLDRPARLGLGEHQRRRDLQDVAANVVDDRAQLPRTVDHLRGEPGIALPGLAGRRVPGRSPGRARGRRRSARSPVSRPARAARRPAAHRPSRPGRAVDRRRWWPAPHDRPRCTPGCPRW